MRYTIFFITLLILASGFIAYFGDLLGRRMGKKRLTIFNLRPRHTAIIVTIITGMLISALVLFALVAVNSGFREILTRGEQIVAQNKQLSKANVELERRNAGLRDRSKDLEEEVSRRERDVERAHADVTKAKAERDRAVADVSVLKKDIDRSQRQLAELKQSAAARQHELAERTRELNATQAALGDTQQKLADANTRLADAETRLGKAEKKLAEAEKRYTETQDNLARAEEQLKAKQVEIDEQQARLAELAQVASRFAEDSASLGYSDSIYRQGEELVRGAISRRQSEFGIRGDLHSLLERASTRALERSAQVGDNGRAVRVIFRQVVGNSYLIYEEDEDKCINDALRTIIRSPQDALVQVVCARNTPPGEQVVVELKLYVNYQIYHKGDLIASTRIDGRLSEGRVLIALIDFLQNEVTESALRKGIIPVSRPDLRSSVERNPREVEGQMHVVDRVRAMNAPSRVLLYASADIYAGDMLTSDNIRFSISKIEQKVGAR